MGLSFAFLKRRCDMKIIARPRRCSFAPHWVWGWCWQSHEQRRNAAFYRRRGKFGWNLNIWWQYFLLQFFDSATAWASWYRSRAPSRWCKSEYCIVRVRHCTWSCLSPMEFCNYSCNWSSQVPKFAGRIMCWNAHSRFSGPCGAWDSWSLFVQFLACTKHTWASKKNGKHCLKDIWRKVFHGILQRRWNIIWINVFLLFCK